MKQNSRLKLFLPLGIFLVLCGFLYVGLFLNKTDLPSALLDEPFPEFQAVGLKDPSQVITRKDVIIGKPALVNVWATWCIACKVEHPFLTDLAERGVAIIGINYKDDRAEALRWLDQLGNPYLFNIADEDGRLGLNLGVYGAPETYLIDAEGVIRYKHIGIVDENVWQDILKPRYEQLQVK
ncbi:DsbE family thiol:disulfide interchange protein [Spongorhabdus nitratireducens]